MATVIGDINVNDHASFSTISSSSHINRTETDARDHAHAGAANDGLPPPPHRPPLPPPRGLVVTLALAPKNRQHLIAARTQICQNLPNQWAFFLYPQQMDMLLVIQEERERQKQQWTVPDFVRCLNLTLSESSASLTPATTGTEGGDGGGPKRRVWHNLDGSTMETLEYLYSGPVVVAPTDCRGTGTRSDTGSDPFASPSSIHSMRNTSNMSPPPPPQPPPPPPPIKIYIGTTTVRYPPYIREDPSLLRLRNSGPPNGCSARLRYLQGCRWYTQEMLHLQILNPSPRQQGGGQQQQHGDVETKDDDDENGNSFYRYFVKMDTDIVFHKSPPFYLLQDMENKGAIFAHTAEYHPDGDGSCAAGILDAVHNFTKGIQQQKQQKEQLRQHDPNSNINSSKNYNNNVLLPSWRASICSDQSPLMQRNADQYYANFIIGRVDYFTSPWVLQFANFLSNYPLGFFRSKWGDQVFWHFAMGLFLSGRPRNQQYKPRRSAFSSPSPSSSPSVAAPSFTDYVVDYTDLRCKPNPQCWYSFAQVETYGPDASTQCRNDDGIFVHTKDLQYAAAQVRKRGDDGIMNTTAVVGPCPARRNGSTTSSGRVGQDDKEADSGYGDVGRLTGIPPNNTGIAPKYGPTLPAWHRDPMLQPLFVSKYTANCNAS